MTQLLTPSSIDRAGLLSFLSTHLEALEPGLELLDRQFEITPGESIDLLARTADRRGVLIDVAEDEDSQQLLRSVARFNWYLANRTMLSRLFPAETLSAGERPRLVLLAPTHSEELRQAVRHLDFTSIVLVEARAFDLRGEKAVALDEVGRSANKSSLGALQLLRAAIDEVPLTDDEVAAFAVPQGSRV